jgi:hypothetical protein
MYASLTLSERDIERVLRGNRIVRSVASDEFGKVICANCGMPAGAAVQTPCKGAPIDTDAEVLARAIEEALPEDVTAAEWAAQVRELGERIASMAS